MLSPSSPTDQPTKLAPEACRHLSVSLPTLYRLVKQGRIRCTRLSPKGKRIFLTAELDRFLQSEPPPAGGPL